MAQSETRSSEESGTNLFGFIPFDYYLIQPNGFLYFDIGKDEEVAEGEKIREADFYKDGQANFSLQMIGGDIFYGESSIRYGLSLGLGLSRGEESSMGSFLLFNVGPAISFGNSIRLEGGWMIGISAKEDLDKITDSAIYIGLSFPIHLSDSIKKLFAD